MNKWRQRHPDFGVKKAKDSTFGELTDDADDADAAEDIYTVATQHRSTVIAKDKVAKARRKKGARRA